MQGVSERTLCLTLKNMSVNSSMDTAVATLTGPEAPSAFLEDGRAAIDLAVFVESPHDAVYVIAFEKRLDEKGTTRVMASAQVPFYDERFSSGLGVDLFLESPQQNHEASLHVVHEIPLKVQASLVGHL